MQLRSYCFLGVCVCVGGVLSPRCRQVLGFSFLLLLLLSWWFWLLPVWLWLTLMASLSDPVCFWSASLHVSHWFDWFRKKLFHSHRSVCVCVCVAFLFLEIFTRVFLCSFTRTTVEATKITCELLSVPSWSTGIRNCTGKRTHTHTINIYVYNVQRSKTFPRPEARGLSVSDGSAGGITILR